MVTNDIPMWVGVLGNFGFPIVITFYLLFRVEKKMENLESVILELAKVIENIKK
ncbi:YvrJ family protein [Priestia aryabhattai]|uniref:YvrJ family protein n=1 Tax=Priestia aryabhattai TaxID=412384 RepID=UPI002EB45327|nr:YvrJ family protein [Priestia aryabhattai]